MRSSATNLLVLAQALRCIGWTTGFVPVRRDIFSSAPALCRVPATPVSEAVVSPFVQSTQKQGSPIVGPLPLTPESVELVLDEMRPYLLADGGNVSLAEIDGGVRCCAPTLQRNDQYVYYRASCTQSST